MLTDNSKPIRKYCFFKKIIIENFSAFEMRKSLIPSCNNLCECQSLDKAPKYNKNQKTRFIVIFRVNKTFSSTTILWIFRRSEKLQRTSPYC